MLDTGAGRLLRASASATVRSRCLYLRSRRQCRGDGYIARILRFCGRLDRFPHRGTSRDDVLPGLRIVGFERRITIAFTTTDESVLIEGIFYGGQDWPAALKAP